MRILSAVVGFSALASVLAMGFPPGASAGLPEPSNSSIPSCIPVMGRDAAGLPDPISQVEVVYRDLANNPIAGAMIVLDFSHCAELRLCADAHEPNVFVDCATRTVRRLSDANGRAIFRVTGWSVGESATPGSGYNDGQVFADGVLLGSPSVSIYDLDRNGLGAGDLNSWLGDFFGAFNPARADYDCSGSLGASDLGHWLGAYFANGSTTNCSPEGPCP